MPKRHFASSRKCCPPHPPREKFKRMPMLVTNALCRWKSPSTEWMTGSRWTIAARTY